MHLINIYKHKEKQLQQKDMKWNIRNTRGGILFELFWLLLCLSAGLILIRTDQAWAQLNWMNVLTVCRSQIICTVTVVCLLKLRRHEVSSAEASCLSSHMTVGWYACEPLANCSLFPPHCIRIWKRVETASPSQPITCCPHHPPVWETSPHWISPMMKNCPQTPATPLTRKKRVSVVWLNRPPQEHSRDEKI